MGENSISNLTKPLAVDEVSINILVDNTIEWFGKLPPGFSNEVNQHLTRPDVPIDEKTKTPVLDLDNYCCGAHGLSIVISTTLDGKTHHTLFDTGPEAQSIARNISALKPPLASINRVVLSHWHRDHSGGILEFLRLASEARAHSADDKPSNKVVVDVHANRPTARGIAPPPKYDRVIARLPEDPTFAEIEAAGGVVEAHLGEAEGADKHRGHAVAGGTVWVSGEIPRAIEFEGGLLSGVRWVENTSGENKEGKWEPEFHIMDERYVAVDVKGKGLIIFSSCSHAGICNVVQDAATRLARPIYMIVAGLHLGGPELHPRIAPTVDFLTRRLRPQPTYILPLHCTGFPAKIALEHAIGEGCVPAGTGSKIVVKGGPDPLADERLWKGEIVD
ncbi:hypothetical protein BOTBODRAFT_99598 [Botryobasidium botryosum FD-172 SS1]|uniref:Metallo-beta-lactamase domain-containing protein n=1 Tax=Botryobasidium botryosum (strain FD-172 SS1) TaxID=930990 RepID=A0A067N223_BOTB1|nr:hypothetical protein BOTBODRAFT_99598 [Botryobasidium botryosum FD-172 SS1]